MSPYCRMLRNLFSGSSVTKKSHLHFCFFLFFWQNVSISCFHFVWVSCDIIIMLLYGKVLPTFYKIYFIIIHGPHDQVIGQSNDNVHSELPLTLHSKNCWSVNLTSSQQATSQRGKYGPTARQLKAQRLALSIDGGSYHFFWRGGYVLLHYYIHYKTRTV